MGRTIYSQLQVATTASTSNSTTAPSTKPLPRTPPAKKALQEEDEEEDKDLGVKTIKPVPETTKPPTTTKPATTKPTIKKRTNVPKLDKPLPKVPSYSTVNKPKAPNLPPRIEENSSEGLKEGLYNVPKSNPKMVVDDASYMYDKPSSVVRAARSCENIGRHQDIEYQNTSSSREDLEASRALYDMPSSSPRQVVSQLCLAWTEDGRSRSNNSMGAQNSASMDSYIDMSGSYV